MKKILVSLIGVAVLILMALSAASPLPVLAASSGPNPGSTFASISFTGADDQWSDPGYAISSNDQHATATIGSSSDVSYYLRATNFSFNIPLGSNITGIEVNIERHGDTGSSGSKIRDYRVRLVTNLTVESTDRAATSLDWPTSDTTKTYGNSTDLWGASWNASDINNTGFGVVLSVTRTSGGDNTAYVDYISMTVYYTGCSNDGQFDVKLVNVTNNLTADTQTWCYNVTNLASGTNCTGMSHWVLDLCDTPTHNVTSSSPSTSYFTDSHFGHGRVIKWEVAVAPGATQSFCFTVDGIWQGVQRDWETRAGDIYDSSTVTGPGCQTFTPPHLEVSKSADPALVCVGGTAPVTLNVTGAGDPSFERLPVDVMLIIDRSGSMAGDKIGATQAAAIAFVDLLDSSQDRVGLVSYASSATLNQGLTTNFTAVKNAISGLSATGATNIGDAIQLANTEFLPPVPVGRPGTVWVEILLTDGLPNQPNGNGRNFNETDAQYARNATQAARASNVTLYTIGLGNSTDPIYGISEYFLDDLPASGHTYQSNDPAGHPYDHDGLAFAGGGTTITLPPPLTCNLSSKRYPRRSAI